MSFVRSIIRDIRAARDRDPAAVSNLEVILTYPGFHARQFHRLSHALYELRVPLMPRLISHLSRFVTGIEIHPGAKIGEGFFVDHGMGVVIGETAEIGDNCSLFQGVTLGGTSTKRTKRHPTLGHDVVVGAGARLIGAIHVGDNARIGAGSVVVTNVPDNDTVVRLPDPEWDRMKVLETRIRGLEKRLRKLEEGQAGVKEPAGRTGRPASAKAGQDKNQ
jgi:serine O-acetyltransferase